MDHEQEDQRKTELLIQISKNSGISADKLLYMFSDQSLKFWESLSLKVPMLPNKMKSADIP